MSEERTPLCWAEIAMLREIREQNAELTDRLFELSRVQSEIVQALSTALQDIQVERLMPYIQRRLDAIMQVQQQRRGAA